MQERRKLFYTKLELDEMSDAIEYTTGSTPALDSIFIPIAHYESVVDTSDNTSSATYAGLIRFNHIDSNGNGVYFLDNNCESFIGPTTGSWYINYSPDDYIYTSTSTNGNPSDARKINILPGDRAYYSYTVFEFFQDLIDDFTDNGNLHYMRLYLGAGYMKSPNGQITYNDNSISYIRRFTVPIYYKIKS